MHATRSSRRTGSGASRLEQSCWNSLVPLWRSDGWRAARTRRATSAFASGVDLSLSAAAIVLDEATAPALARGPSTLDGSLTESLALPVGASVPLRGVEAGREASCRPVALACAAAAVALGPLPLLDFPAPRADDRFEPTAGSVESIALEPLGWAQLTPPLPRPRSALPQTLASSSSAFVAPSSSSSSSPWNDASSPAARGSTDVAPLAACPRGGGMPCWEWPYDSRLSLTARASWAS